MNPDSDWRLVAFGQLYHEPSRNGLTRPRKVRGSGYKMINMGELFSHDRIWDIPMERVPMSENELGKFTVVPLDLMFARQSMVEAGAGKCSIVLSVPEATCFESHLIRVRLDQRKCSPLFYYYYFRSSLGRSKIETIITGAAQKGIRGSELGELLIDFPPLPTQQRIAAILSAYDDLIETNTRRIAILEEMARRLYEEWFVHFRFPAAGATTISAARLLDLADVAYGKGLPSKNLINDGDYPVYGAAKIIGRYSTFTESDRTIIAGCRGSVGRFTITEPKCFVTNNSFTFKPNEPLDFFWLFFALSDRGLADVVSGSAQPQITLASLSNVELPRPPAADRERFADLVRPSMEAVWNHHERNKNLRAQRDLLLPKLVSGEIDVSEAEKAMEAAE